MLITDTDFFIAELIFYITLLGAGYFSLRPHIADVMQFDPKTKVLFVIVLIVGFIIIQTIIEKLGISNWITQNISKRILEFLIINTARIDLFLHTNF